MKTDIPLILNREVILPLLLSFLGVNSCSNMVKCLDGTGASGSTCWQRYGYLQTSAEPHIRAEGKVCLRDKAYDVCTRSTLCMYVCSQCRYLCTAGTVPSVAAICTYVQCQVVLGTLYLVPSTKYTQYIQHDVKSCRCFTQRVISKKRCRCHTTKAWGKTVQP